MKKPIDLPAYKNDYKYAVVGFNKETSHYSVLYQAITELAKAGFAPEQEIIDEWITLLKSEKGEL